MYYDVILLYFCITYVVSNGVWLVVAKNNLRAMKEQPFSEILSHLKKLSSFTSLWDNCDRTVE